jgi:hypothetical protein
MPAAASVFATMPAAAVSATVPAAVSATVPAATVSAATALRVCFECEKRRPRAAIFLTVFAATSRNTAAISRKRLVEMQLICRFEPALPPDARR